MEEALSFDEAIKPIHGAKALLIGNGFSMARGGGEFSYSTLLEKCPLPQDHVIRKVFSALDTKDFEIVMRSIEHAGTIELIYGDKKRADQFIDDAKAVREALIQTIHEVHPGAHFEIPAEQGEACGKFLSRFDKIFTVNYDLLLYWVILRNTKGFTDGFGSGETVNGFRTFSKNSSCNTFYLHGALHLFLNEKRDTLKRVLTGSTIINDIAETIRARVQPPLIVAEGTANQKLSKIRSVPYLEYCFDQFSNLTGALIIFGLSATEKDFHIYDAICESFNLKKVVYCVHEPRNNLDKIREELARYAERRRDIQWVYVDAATAPVWV